MPTMDNLTTTHHYIADILSFEVSNSELEKTLRNSSFNWDAIVIEGSKHLVLPAIYCRLREKKLLHVLPTELDVYLEELTAINRSRNESILKQVNFIAQLLNQHAIEYVFLKGSALLAMGCFQDNAERMVGDIDILVKDSQINDAFQLLKTNGYNKTSGFAYKQKDYRHLDRLISNHYIAAIELHSQLLNKKYWSLIDIPSIFTSNLVIDNISIPNADVMSTHQILAKQVNDNGHYYNSLSLKSIYDLIILKKHKDPTFISNLLKSKYGQSYVALSQNYFKDFSHIPANTYMKYIRFSHNTQVSFNPINGFIKHIKFSLNFIGHRITLLCTNKYYTKHIFNKIFRNKTSV